MSTKQRTLCTPLAGLVLALVVGAPIPAQADDELRICAEPDNLPFSNEQRQGFENRITEVVADALQVKPVYYWQKQRQGFIRETLNAGFCDVVMGVPRGYQRVRTTDAYYRSGYVWIARRDSGWVFESFDDPRLKTLKIGLHAIGNDGANSPPAAALAKRGIAENVVGYSLWGEQSQVNPQGDIVEAVVNGDIDLAIVWGPIAGYFAKLHGDKLSLGLLDADPTLPSMPFVYELAMGVRKSDTALAERLNAALAGKRQVIDDILAAYRIPIAPLNQQQHTADAQSDGTEKIN